MLITIENRSGGPQGVAIFITDGSNPDAFSLVWQRMVIESGNTKSFNEIEFAYGLGWGRTSQPIRMCVPYRSCSTPAQVFPKTANGVNTLPITYCNGDFLMEEPYVDKTLSDQIKIVTDTSFRVTDAIATNVGLYVDGLPAIALQAAPNTDYYFDITQFSFYLTVTDAPEGVALPRTAGNPLVRSSIASVSISRPFPISFPRDGAELHYFLDETRQFHDLS